MKYRFTLDYAESAVVAGKPVTFVPGQVYDLEQVPNRVAAHLVPVQEEAPVKEKPVAPVKKVTKRKKQS